MRRRVSSTDALSKLQSELQEANQERQNILSGMCRSDNTMKGNHPADAADASVNHQVLLNKVNKRITAINASIGRINDKTYGICCDCNRAIPKKRLVSHWTAKRCVPCQEAHERLGGR
jgi:DnaK suppressor protein